MKQFRHKPTGRIYTNNEQIYYWLEGKPGMESVPSHIVESGSDWELIEIYRKIPIPEKIVPPGIVAFKNSKGRLVGELKDEGPRLSYEEWVRIYLLEYNPWEVYTIKIDGVEWSVGDYVHLPYDKDRHIERFEYKNNQWNVWSGGMFCAVALLRKVPDRKPVCQLPDEHGNMVDMYEDMQYWFTDHSNKDANVYSNTMKCYVMNKVNNGNKHLTQYATKAAAEEAHKNKWKKIYSLNDLEKAWDQGWNLAYLQGRNKEDEIYFHDFKTWAKQYNQNSK